jgi:hypothetical protein
VRIETTAQFRRCLRGFPDGRLESILDAMRAAAAAYGRPHLHGGIGLRIIGDFIECRDALDHRLLFQRDGGSLVFRFYGTHDEVRAFLRNRRK